MKPHKMDKKLVSVNQESELDTIVQKMKEEGIKISRDDVREAVKEAGRSRAKVEAYLRLNHAAEQAEDTIMD